MGAGGTATLAGNVLTLDAWNHVVLTLDKEDNGGWLRLYVNGLQVGDQAFAATPLATALSFDIGRSSSAGYVKVPQLFMFRPGDPEGDTDMHLTKDGGTVWSRDIPGFGVQHETINYESTTGRNTTLGMWEYDGDQPLVHYGDDTCNFTGIGTTLSLASTQPSFPDTSYDFTDCGDGHLHVQFDNNSIPFYGDMDELQIFGQPLDEAAVRRLYLDAATLLRLPVLHSPRVARRPRPPRPLVPPGIDAPPDLR